MLSSGLTKDYLEDNILLMNIDDVSNKEKVIADLKNGLKQADLTYAWAARQLKLSIPHFNRVVNFQTNPSLETVIKLHALSCRLKRLAG